MPLGNGLRTLNTLSQVNRLPRYCRITRLAFIYYCYSKYKPDRRKQNKKNFFKKNSGDLNYGKIASLSNNSMVDCSDGDLNNGLKVSYLYAGTIWIHHSDPRCNKCFFLYGCLDWDLAFSLHWKSETEWMCGWK